MGVTTNCNLTFYSQEKEVIERIELDTLVDSFVYHLVNDGGASFQPEAIHPFTEAEKEVVKIYFDKISMSVAEELATVTPHIQDPEKLLGVWLKIKDGVLQQENDDRLLEFFNQLTNLLQLGIQHQLLVEMTVSDF